MVRRKRTITIACCLWATVAACATGATSADDDIAGTTTSTSAPMSCATNLQLCGIDCVDLNSDNQHCGGCDLACSGEEACLAGECLSQCSGGATKCGEECVDAKFDPQHCGACDATCTAVANATAVCLDGTCDWICQPDHQNCNQLSDDGCEASLNDDPTNCSKCGAACAAVTNGTPGCQNGKCVIDSCATGYDDCNQLGDDGCETDLSSDPKNCSKCGNACNPANQEQCKNGQCLKAPFNYQILEQKDVNYKGIDYLVLKVAYLSDTAAGENWCADYMNMCLGFGYLPTGCGNKFNNGGYGYCKTKYKSDGVSDTLSCNASSGVAAAAQQAGYADASSTNSFAFHSCNDGPSSSCGKTMCTGDYCNNALSYFSYGKPHGYTLCKK